MKESLKAENKKLGPSEGCVFALLFCSTFWCVVGTIIFQILTK